MEINVDEFLKSSLFSASEEPPWSATTMTVTRNLNSESVPAARGRVRVPAQRPTQSQSRNPDSVVT